MTITFRCQFQRIILNKPKMLLHILRQTFKINRVFVIESAHIRIDAEFIPTFAQLLVNFFILLFHDSFGYLGIILVSAVRDTRYLALQFIPIERATDLFFMDTALTPTVAKVI